MPKTIVKVKTFICPNGAGKINGECRFHRAYNNLPVDGKCPSCRLDLVRATSPDDQMTMTVMGEENIEPEIEKMNERKGKGESLGGDVDVSTEAKKNTYRNKRKQDIKDAIKEAKKHEDTEAN